MSTITGAPAGISPDPDSCPSADCAPWETITSAGSSQPCSSATADIAARTSSDVRPGRSSRISVAATPIAASAAFCARRMPSSSAAGLHAPALDELVVVDGQLQAVRAHVVGDEQRELRRHRGRRRSPARARRAGPARRRCRAPLLLGRVSSSRPERARVDHLDAVRRDVDRVEHRDRGDPAAVVLQVEERVADPGRDLVEQRRRGLGRRVDQDGDGITSKRASTSGTWRT